MDIILSVVTQIGPFPWGLTALRAWETILLRTHVCERHRMIAASATLTWERWDQGGELEIELIPIVLQV